MSRQNSLSKIYEHVWNTLQSKPFSHSLCNIAFLSSVLSIGFVVFRFKHQSVLLRQYNWCLGLFISIFSLFKHGWLFGHHKEQFSAIIYHKSCVSVSCNSKPNSGYYLRNQRFRSHDWFSKFKYSLYTFKYFVTMTCEWQA